MPYSVVRTKRSRSVTVPSNVGGSAPRVAAMLFGRAGSLGVPGKNVKRILGRPSLHYPLMAARASGIVTDVYVSTDSEEILRLARPFSPREIVRPSRLATHDAMLEDAIHYTLQVIDQRWSITYEFYLILLCNAVTVLPERLREAQARLLADPRADSVTSVARWNMFSPVRAHVIDRTDRQILKAYVPLETLGQVTRISSSRDKAQDCYFCDHSFTLARRATLADIPTNPGPFPWMGRRVLAVEQMPGAGDVDLPWQVPVVEWWLKQHGFTPRRLPYRLPRTASSRMSNGSL